MYILGISAFFHDAAACLIKDGKIIAAMQEERFTRVKHDASFPENAIRGCLDSAGINMDDIHYVGFFEKPHRKFDRLLTIFGSYFPKGFDIFSMALPRWIFGKLDLPVLIASRLTAMSPSGGASAIWDGNVIFSSHHMSHAAAAFFPSPFEDASILIMDGVGEWATTSIASGTTDHRGVPSISMIKEIHFPHSLGLLYSAFTQYLGFKVNSGEYKVMGLAPYGVPKYKRVILENLIRVEDDGSFHLDDDHFCFAYSRTMTSPSFNRFFESGPRMAGEPVLQDHMDIAASIQAVTEDIIMTVATHIHAETGAKNLCLAGGVALNCVANGKLLREGPFENIWVQPAAGDAGSALGAAYFIWHNILKKRRPDRAPRKDIMQGGYLGSAYTSEQIDQAFNEYDLKPEILEREEKLKRTAKLIADGKVVGWFNGRMEFGPRALGSRSILADPRTAEMRRSLNLKIKYRESFRPFAASVLMEYASDWFDLSWEKSSGEHASCAESPYMLLVGHVSKDRRHSDNAEYDDVRSIELANVKRNEIPACSHVDHSSRIQTVTSDTNPDYADLISEFNKLTGFPMIVNTSFNVRGEPIVESPAHALKCFLGTEMDALVIEDRLILKKDVPEALLIKNANHVDSFELD